MSLISSLNPFNWFRSNARSRQVGDSTLAQRANSNLRSSLDPLNTDAFHDRQSSMPSLMSRGGARAERNGSLAGFDTNAFVEGPSFNVTGDASIERNGLGCDIKVDLAIDADLVRAGASATREFNFRVNGEDVRVRIDLGAEGAIGVDGQLHLNVHLGTDGIAVQANAEGFAGARGALTGGIDVAVNGHEVVDGQLTLAATAGVAGAASFELGRDGFRARAGAALGVGFGVDVQGHWDSSALVRSAGGLLLPGHQGW